MARAPSSCIRISRRSTKASTCASRRRCPKPRSHSRFGRPAMIAIAHFVAISCYVGAAALAAVPFARPVQAPLRGVLAVLGLGIAAHAAALLAYALQVDSLPLTGLGPSLSFAGLVLAFTLLVVEVLARDVSLTLVAAPLAALSTICANVIGLTPFHAAEGVRGAWLFAHIALSFVGIAAFATAAAAGTMYLLQRRELKSRRFR